MTTKKRILLIAALPLAIVVTFGVLALLPPRPGITKANFDRIQAGMKKTEVEQIFGGKGKSSPFRALVVRRDFDGGAVMCWDSDIGSWAGILFVDECVLEKQWHNSNETILDRIRRWLHLR